ncbi:MAG: beta-galactosidase [bacterium]
MFLRLTLLSLILFSVCCSENPQDREQIVWPSYENLPEALKTDRHPIRLQQNAFVSQDGRRTFVIATYGRDDPRFDLYGKRDLAELPPNYALYDPKRHGWIYEQPLDAKSACRLGFNSYSISLTPKPFYDLVGYRARVPEDPDYIGTFAHALGFPIYVDYVAWPWGLGAPGQPNSDALPQECINPHGSHWMPYKTIGEGRKIWLQMWRLYAQKLRDANVPVLMYELFNEPGYAAHTADHREEFIQWLQKRYGSLQAVNETWGSSWTSWEAIRDHSSPRNDACLWLDYDEYLAGTFAELFQAGREAIREIDSNAICVMQPRRNGALIPFDAVHYSRILDYQEVVVAPTNGGLWTPGEVSDQPSQNWLDTPLAPAPISSDLILEMAGNRMVFDNEMYLTGQTCRSTRNDWWTRVLLGYDGATLFSWSKRGWAWWEGKETLEAEALKHPYASLLPLARRTEALRGILDFALEMEKVRDCVLPKPWGPRTPIGFLWIWGNARRLACDGRLPEKTMAYYAALKCTHWPFEMIPSNTATIENLSKYEIIILAGTKYLEPEIAQNLEMYVRNGGLLLLGEETASQTPYGQSNGFTEIIGIHAGDYESTQSRVSRPQSLRNSFVPDELDRIERIRRLRLSEDVRPIIEDSLLQPIVIEKCLDDGRVWYQTADLRGYRLATLLSWLLETAGIAGEISIYDTDTGKCATNILVSLRDYGARRAILLRNQDRYPKNLSVRVPPRSGEWMVRDPLNEIQIDPPPGQTVWSNADLECGGIPLTLGPQDFRLLILERK